MFAECLVIGVQGESWVVKGAYGGVSEIKVCSMKIKCDKGWLKLGSQV